MPKSGKVISLRPPPTGRSGLEGQDLAPYFGARQRLTDFLIGYSLVESYFNFEQHRRAYPFVAKATASPGSVVGTHEHVFQNTAFIVLLDETLPQSLNKHFRLRNSNRVTWRNIRRLAPNIDLSGFKSAHLNVTSPGFEKLLRQLVALDYALLIGRDPANTGTSGEVPCRLDHMHVKVERLTDTAIKDLGKALGYVERRLFERGEDYVDSLEAKFFEYHGFSASASGRKSAAAMAAQLLGGEGRDFTVFVANQDDCRLTVLDNSDFVTQYFLVRLEKADRKRFLDTARAAGIEDISPYTVIRSSAGGPVVVHRIRYRHARPATPGARSAHDRLLTAPWLEIADETVLAPPNRTRQGLPMEIAFSWAGHPKKAD